MKIIYRIYSESDKVGNSFNNNLNKQKSTKVSAIAKFSWFCKKK